MSRPLKVLEFRPSRRSHDRCQRPPYTESDRSRAAVPNPASASSVRRVAFRPTAVIVSGAVPRATSAFRTWRPREPVAPNTSVRGSGTVVEGDLVAIQVSEGEGPAEGAIDRGGHYGLAIGYQGVVDGLGVGGMQAGIKWVPRGGGKASPMPGRPTTNTWAKRSTKGWSTSADMCPSRTDTASRWPSSRGRRSTSTAFRSSTRIRSDTSATTADLSLPTTRSKREHQLRPW